MASNAENVGLVWTIIIKLMHVVAHKTVKQMYFPSNRKGIFR